MSLMPATPKECGMTILMWKKAASLSCAVLATAIAGASLMGCVAMASVRITVRNELDAPRRVVIFTRESAVECQYENGILGAGRDFARNLSVEDGRIVH